MDDESLVERVAGELKCIHPDTLPCAIACALERTLRARTLIAGTEPNSTNVEEIRAEVRTAILLYFRGGATWVSE